MEPQPYLSPNEFKALYKNPMIQSIKLFTKRNDPQMPITYARIIDITEDIVVYWHDQNLSKWHLMGYTP